MYHFIAYIYLKTLNINNVKTCESKILGYFESFLCLKGQTSVLWWERKVYSLGEEGERHL